MNKVYWAIMISLLLLWIYLGYSLVNMLREERITLAAFKAECISQGNHIEYDLKDHMGCYRGPAPELIKYL